MNWIKVTEKTNIPSGVTVLFKTIILGRILMGRTIPQTPGTIELHGSETVYIKGEYSHYCVITEPTEINDTSELTPISKARNLSYRDDLTKGKLIRRDLFKKHTYIDECSHLISEIEKGAQMRLHESSDYDNGVSSIKTTIFFFPKDD